MDIDFYFYFFIVKYVQYFDFEMFFKLDHFEKNIQ